LFPEPDKTCNDIGAEYFYQQLDVPEALEPEDISKDAFLAVWTSAYGALGYYLDVALDDGFSNMVYGDIKVVGKTNFKVEGLSTGTTYYYRVKSYNTALTSSYSNTQPATTLMVSVKDLSMDDVSIYSYKGAVYIDMDRAAYTPGTIHIYDVVCKLLVQKQLQQGYNKIDLKGSGQVIIVKAVVGENVLQRKLLINQ
jgi:hypothetical protein